MGAIKNALFTCAEILYHRIAVAVNYAYYISLRVSHVIIHCAVVLAGGYAVEIVKEFQSVALLQQSAVAVVKVSYVVLFYSSAATVILERVAVERHHLSALPRGGLAEVNS